MSENNIDKFCDQIKINIKNYLIGCALSDIRKKRKMSLKTVADYLQISVQELQSYEEGFREINIVILFKLGKLFNASIDDFFKYCNQL